MGPQFLLLDTDKPACICTLPVPREWKTKQLKQNADLLSAHEITIYHYLLWEAEIKNGKILIQVFLIRVGTAEEGEGERNRYFSPQSGVWGNQLGTGISFKERSLGENKSPKATQQVLHPTHLVATDTISLLNFGGLKCRLNPSDESYQAKNNLILFVIYDVIVSS